MKSGRHQHRRLPTKLSLLPGLPSGDRGAMPLRRGLTPKVLWHGCARSRG